MTELNDIIPPTALFILFGLGSILIVVCIFFIYIGFAKDDSAEDVDDLEQDDAMIFSKHGFKKCVQCGFETTLPKCPVCNNKGGYME